MPNYETTRRQHIEALGTAERARMAAAARRRPPTKGRRRRLLARRRLRAWLQEGWA